MFRGFILHLENADIAFQYLYTIRFLKILSPVRFNEKLGICILYHLKMLRYPARYFQRVWVSQRMDVADGDDECFLRGIRLHLLSQLRLTSTIRMPNYRTTTVTCATIDLFTKTKRL
jgi:hypothetical protein